MNKEKMKELLKNKKVMIISGLALVGVIALGSVGYIMATSNKEEAKTENKVVVSNKKNEKDVKESDNKSKEATNKKEDKVNKESSTENKVDTEEKKEVASNESKNSTSSNKPIEKNNTNNSSNNEVNSVVGNTSQETAEKPSKPTNINTNTDTNTHTHSWVEQLQTVNYQEQGHYEDVLVSAAWSEQIPVYDYVYRKICNGCKADISGFHNEHMEEQMLAGILSCGSWTGKYVDIQVGTETVNHEAVYDKKYVVDKAAWTENVVSGYKCSCGATK